MPLVQDNQVIQALAPVSTPSIIDATEEIKSSSGLKTERSFTFYTHTIEDIQIVGVKDLGNDTYEIKYKPVFKRVNDDYMKHVPQRSDPALLLTSACSVKT